jgi:N-acetyl-gamma-glutamylphosphate reductase
MIMPLHSVRWDVVVIRVGIVGAAGYAGGELMELTATSQTAALKRETHVRLKQLRLNNMDGCSAVQAPGIL